MKKMNIIAGSVCKLQNPRKVRMGLSMSLKTIVQNGLKVILLFLICALCGCLFDKHWVGKKPEVSVLAEDMTKEDAANIVKSTIQKSIIYPMRLVIANEHIRMIGSPDTFSVDESKIVYRGIIVMYFNQVDEIHLVFVGGNTQEVTLRRTNPKEKFISLYVRNGDDLNRFLAALEVLCPNLQKK